MATDSQGFLSNIFIVLQPMYIPQAFGPKPKFNKSAIHKNSKFSTLGKQQCNPGNKLRYFGI